MEGRNDAEGTKKVGAGDRSRTYTGVSPEDFESSASAIPPLRHSGNRHFTSRDDG
jgi:hypothetical protein